MKMKDIGEQKRESKSWGIGLLIHAFSVFGTKMFLKDWEEKKIKELMEKDKNKGK